MPRLPLLLALTALVALPGCGPDGCGSDPNAPAPAKQEASSGGGGGGGGHSGGGEAAKIEGEKQAPQKPQDTTTPADAKGKPAPKSEKGVIAAPEYAAAGKPADPSASIEKPGMALMRVVLVCKKSEPACGSASAALADARKGWGARIAVERVDLEKASPPEGLEADPLPGWGLYRGSERVSVRQGAPFEPKKGRGGEPLENETEYRKRLAAWLKAGVEAGDLNRAR